MAVVYQASISGSLTSTILQYDAPYTGFVRDLAKIAYGCVIEVAGIPRGRWTPDFNTINISYEGLLYLDVTPGTTSRVERMSATLTGGPASSGGFVGATSGTFAPTVTITVEQIGSDVKITFVGALGTWSKTHTNQHFVRVINHWAIARAAGRFNPVVVHSFYGEVISAACPTCSFSDGGVGVANWSDWDTLAATSSFSDFWTDSYNGNATIIEDSWPPEAAYSAWHQVRVDEDCSNKYSITFHQAAYALTIQSTPPTGVSIKFAPLPEDGTTSPQDTYFILYYGNRYLWVEDPYYGEDIEFSPDPDFTGWTSPQKGGRLYYTYYQVKYGGKPFSVVLTAPTDYDRINFVKWQWALEGEVVQETVNNVLTLGVLTKNVLNCRPYFSWDIQVVAPAANPSGYRWLYWDFGGGDERSAKTQEFLLDADKTIIATYEEGFPVLGITQHFSGSILATDSGLTTGPDAGQHKIQRGTWSERFPVPDSENTIWANPFTTKSRTELIEGKGNIQTRFANSLDGDWQAAQELEADYSCPYGIEALGMLYISAYKDGKQYLLRRQRHGEHTAMEAPLEIADSDEVAASLAFFPLQWSLACAVQCNDNTNLYLSQNHGQSWELKHTIKSLLYPSLFCDEKLLWLVGYVDGAYEGASGRVAVAAYRVSSLALPESQALTTIGPADAGRPAIIREKNTWLVRTLAPRTTDWGDGEAAPSIVEYVSDDVGQTWSQAGVHAV